MSVLIEPRTAQSAVSAKLVVAGGFGVGKTTFVGAVSEIDPLRTEETMTVAAASEDDSSLVDTKDSTTVAMDFGRISVDESFKLYLFGTPGQSRFSFMWDRIGDGALGAVVLLDTARLDECFPAIDYFEHRRIPFVVAVNQFPKSPVGTVDQVRTALALDTAIPVLSVDARSRESVKSALLSLLDHLLASLGATQGDLSTSP